jgi:hypothetical protein
VDWGGGYVSCGGDVDDMRIDKARKRQPSFKTLILTRRLANFAILDGFLGVAQQTYLSSSVLRRALGLREFAFAALATVVHAIVAAALSTAAHHVLVRRDGRVDVMTVRTGTRGWDFGVAMRVRGVDDRGQLRS